MVIDRLLRAAATPDVLREMRIEDEFLSELERLDTALMLKDQALEHKEQELEANRQALEQKNRSIEQKNKMLISLLQAQGATSKAIADQLQLTEEDVERLLR